MEVGRSLQDPSRHGGRVRVSLFGGSSTSYSSNVITSFEVPREDNLSKLDPLRMDERGIRAALQRQRTPFAE